MILPREALEELKGIYKEEYGEELSDKEIQEMAMRLLRLFQLLRYKPPSNLTDSERIDNMNH